MDLNTQIHLKPLRESLQYRLNELRGELHAAELARQADPGVGAEYVTDQKDVASQQQLSDIMGAQEQRDFEEAQLVESALRRLDEGTYGDCSDCGEPIPLQRLQVQPAAQRCAPCQAAHEGIAGQAGQRQRTWPCPT